jgi:hypothetical protein
MSKLKVQMKSETQMTKLKKREKVLALNHFDIPLAFGF